MEPSEGHWRLWVDTGGTFTDCLGISPRGDRRRVKVLSSSSVRGRLRVDGKGLRVEQAFDVPEDFFVGYRLEVAAGSGEERVIGTVVGFDPENGAVELEAVAVKPAPDALVSLHSPEEAPLLAARLLCRRRLGEPLDDVQMRLATTRGTNALLERKGAPTVLFVTAGHRDLLRIGNQARRDIFALDVRRAEPLYSAVVEVPERLDAGGRVLEELRADRLEPRIERLVGEGYRCAAVALLHSYLEPKHERALAGLLRQHGFEYVTCSHEVAPLIKILPRAETAVVDAYLAPVIESYVEAVSSRLPAATLHMMTSAGGLVRAGGFHPRDSLLSGPAGGVVGAAHSGREAGFASILGFDMGGTSTDVSRVAGDFDYTFEHRVGDAAIMAPALVIETVAAGGGSICTFDGLQLKVGPESAGADPGPACYGAGGPLTLTDVNLLLGRLDPDRFEIPIDRSASQLRLEALLAEVEEATGERPGAEELLAGFLAIANERMADAIRRISVQRGYDPRDHALVSFGGAGGQHATAIAAALGVGEVVIPEDASLLSALGLGAAVVERFAQRQVLTPLDSGLEQQLGQWFEELDREALEAVAAEGVEGGQARIRRRWLRLRLLGQESTVEVDWRRDSDVVATFSRSYRELYGYPPPERPIEVESAGVVASSPGTPLPAYGAAFESEGRALLHQGRAWFEGGWQEVPVWWREQLTGEPIEGPALVVEQHSVTVVEPGWSARREVRSRALVLVRDGENGPTGD